ncbi:ABC transporter ATP-binding protein [Pseudorhodoplanes sp.]|uniref:ABC transporter ATP-binding protein n=1 Tax=Pseudorhodoplanes sp. TaxID=1934341 RepID=UPI003D130934
MAQTKSTPDATPFLEVRGLHTHYGTSHVLRGIDMKIWLGETIGLLGRNGMGKTTLLRSILGLVVPSRGQIVINGQSVKGVPPHLIARKGIGYVPEGRGIFTKLSVYEHLEMAARPGVRGQRDWTPERVYASFPRLAERINHNANDLSGGEQQMLSIGRALVTNPDLLILDEATEGLAPLIAKEIWSIISVIRQNGIGAIVVDKNVSAVSKLADRNLILVKGSVAFEGGSDELHASPEILRNFVGV